MKKLFTSLILLALINFTCHASGYQVLLQGNRTTGMGNLGTAMYGDASSLFFNPGAMGFLDHNSVLVGFNPIFATNAYWDSETPNSSYTAETDNPMGTPFHAYVVWGPNESNLKFGLGAFTPFGSSVNWGTMWTGRDLLNELTLRAIQIQPTVAYKLGDKFSVGAGLDITLGSVKLMRTITSFEGRTDDNQYSQGSVTLDGKASTAFGFNIGLFYQASEKIDIGVSYRSKVDMNVKDGDTEFVVPSSLSGGFPENTFDASLPLPSVATVGLTYHLSDNFELGAQFDWVGWSAYESLNIDFEKDALNYDEGNEPQPLVTDSNSPRNYEDSWVAHIGGEYRLESSLALRAGFYYDVTPVQDGYMTAETPDNNRIGLTAGLGYSVGNFQLDLSFLYINSGEREQTTQQAIDAGTFDPSTGSRDVLPGTYRLNAFIPGFSIAYKF